MLEEQFTYRINDKDYPVIVIRKRMRSIRYRYKDGTFIVTAPKLFVSQKKIKEGLDKFAVKLLNSDQKSKAIGDDYIYILGIKVNIQEVGEIVFTNGEIISYKSKEDLNKKLKKWFLKYLTNETRYYEQVMGIEKPYNVRVRNMSSRYGSNSSGTHSLSFSMILLHYSRDIIDSVIIHELAHDKIKNHSKKFYDVVYKYCPNYDALHKRLRKGEF